jgi:hypothetical protein
MRTAGYQADDRSLAADGFDETPERAGESVAVGLVKIFDRRRVGVRVNLAADAGLFRRS